jgi:hypothetical protein
VTVGGGGVLGPEASLDAAVAVSIRLRAYVDLERVMMMLDAVGDPLAEVLRDALDSIWHELSADQKALLDRRVQAPRSCQ